jgi:hypothetical protein
LKFFLPSHPARCLLPLFLLFALFLAFPGRGWALEPAGNPPPPQSENAINGVAEPEPGKTVTELPPVTVVGIIENRATGRSVIRGEVIPLLPKNNGSINEALEVIPDVQVEGANTSLTGGEILPPKVSISGGKAYQNNFLIDGISNRNLLDPGGKFTEPGNVDDVPGQPQELFMQADLADRITVYDSNIPVEFGNFTGGVVDTRTRNPAPVFGGRAFYRTTRDEWTWFHVNSGDQYDFEHSKDASLQPRFEKQNGGVDLDIPLNDRMGLLLSYRILHSEIPLEYFDGTRDQDRQLQNYFLKYAYTPSSADQIEFSALYAPYQGDYFLKNTMDSDFTLEAGGYHFGLDWQHFFDNLEMRLGASYGWNQNRRKAPANFYRWAVTDSRNWGGLIDSGFSDEGGYGDIKKTQEDMGVRGLFALESLSLGPFSHVLRTGFDLQRLSGTFDRQDTTYVYKDPAISPDIQCGNDTSGCIDGEQYSTFRQVYDAGSVSAAIDQVSFFFEDLLRYRRLELRPGVRFSYDDFMHNTDFAPRLAATYDLFGNGKTLLIGGWNRYYGSPLLTAKLREAKQPYRSESRSSWHNALLPWESAAEQGQNVTKFSNLKTPYADEVALGLDQSLFGGRLSAKYVRRDGKDEFARAYGDLQPDGLRYYTMTNAGSSRHESYRLSWERSWGRHFLSINATYQESSASNESYDELLDSAELEDRVWYDGQILYKSDLPRDQFNHPWLANLTYVGRMPWGFTFVNIARYRSGYRNLEPTGRTVAVPPGEQRTDPLTGEPIVEVLPVYEKVNRPAAVIFDWKLHWERTFFKRQIFGVDLEVYNVFNAKAYTGAAADSFEMGRQFWVGMNYGF